MNADFRSIALLSDLHIDADPSKTRFGHHPANQLRSVVAALFAEPVDAVFIAGDCASRRGEPDDYRQLRSLLAPLEAAGVPVFPIAGNHDERRALNTHFPNPTADESAVRHCIDTGPLRWLLIDTRRAGTEVSGEVDATEAAWIRSRIAPSRPVILIGHHHLEDPGRDDVDRGIGLLESEAFIELLDDVPEIVAYLHGHSHSWWTGLTPGGTHLVNLPSTAFAFRPGQPLGWVRAEIDTGEVRLMLRCLDSSHAAQGETIVIPTAAPDR